MAREPETYRIALHIENAPSEIEVLSRELQSSLNPQVYKQLSEWIKITKKNVIEPIREIVEKRYRHILTLARHMNRSREKEQMRSYMRDFFQSIEPRSIAVEIRETCKPDRFLRIYEETLSQLEKSRQIGILVHRYHLPREIVSFLWNTCMKPLKSAFEALGVHSNQMKAHIELLQNLSKQKGIRIAINIASSIIGGVLLGPFGRIGARLLAQSITDPSSKIDESFQRVNETFENFRSSFSSAMERVDTNVLYIMLSLYGGLLLRIERDLNALGKSLLSVDLHTGEIQIGLSPKALEEFNAWAQATLQKLETLKAQEKWWILGDAADKALRFTIADPYRASVVEKNSTTAYAVEFARMRAIAINKVADTAWRMGKIEDACNLYRHLLTSTSVAWERTNQRKQGSPDESLYVAGLRLAIAATLIDKGQVNIDDLALLPASVAQIITRLSDAGSPRVPGEGLSETTILLAKIIAIYAKEQGIDLRIKDNIPDYWTTISKRKRVSISEIYDLVDEYTRTAYKETSRFLTWLAERARVEKRIKFLRRVAVSLMITVSVIGGYFIIRWIIF